MNNTCQRWKKWLRSTGLGRSSVEYPEIIVDDGDANIVFRCVCAGIQKNLWTGQEVEPSESLGKLALDNHKHSLWACETRLAGQCDRPQEHEKGHWTILLFLTTWKIKSCVRLPLDNNRHHH